MNNTFETKKIKPFLRGHFHQAAFFFSLGACAMLIAKSSKSNSLVSIIIYSISICGLFGVSALYHRITWSENLRRWMRRLDHAFIFILIAGTGTPIGHLALPNKSSSQFLIIIWFMAAIGIIQSLFLIKTPNWISALLYLFMGWLVVPFLPDLNASLNFIQLLFLWLGGIVYTIGAIVFAFKFPNPSPKTFGYHEIFCGGKVRIISAIEDPKTIRQILDHLGIPSSPPRLRSGPAPPQPDQADLFHQEFPKD